MTLLAMLAPYAIYIIVIGLLLALTALGIAISMYFMDTEEPEPVTHFYVVPRGLHRAPLRMSRDDFDYSWSYA